MTSSIESLLNIFILQNWLILMIVAETLTG